ncbi:MAG: hypothetical protein HC871_09380 [Rhizobiales bacterium]|nr:hypothetical protein [Hyphomicrobiales bacterium]
MSPRRLQLIGAGALAAYAVIATAAAFGITGPTTHPSREVYPFFSWSLFSAISDARSEYHIAVHAIDGRRLDPAADLRDIQVFPSFSDSTSLRHKAVQNLGDAISDGLETGEVKLEQFGDRFFGRHDVEFAISRHDYNPLRRWREGPSSDEVTLLGRFSYEGGP